ncbi:hypothetical protein D7V80_12885 [Corallococcus sp. CA054B]|nr:hypothetical protein D7V80_12885 [Corallococcus sp. CA054B]
MATTSTSWSVSRNVIVGVSFNPEGTVILKVILVPSLTEIRSGLGSFSLKSMMMVLGSMVVSLSSSESFRGPSSAAPVP